MSPLIDRTMMETVFPADELVTLDDHALAAMAHEPTKTFLREIGLPDRYGWFEADQRLLDGDLRIGGDAWRTVALKYPSCPFDMSAWLSLGGIALDDVVVDTVTGVVYCVPEDGSPHLLNTSIDTLAYFLHALEEERPEYDPEAATDEGVDPEGAARRLLSRMRRADTAAVQHPESTWFSVLRHVRNLLQT
ncbi:SUKH-4 immunity protein [Nonomuraea maritima]|uniref:SUKH-4 immunity protein n=1 Tax=Nonomuraea maritima TaxID=683260 RepID=A0A1G8U829_9ACTN|nr:SUKH-4 family immunity protein [Nonomuraea maritima]SDJ49881.1 SUKH-4 immunity protein [Nonomuraea maritima]